MPRTIFNAEGEARDATERRLPHEDLLANQILSLCLDGLSELIPYPIEPVWQRSLLELAISSVNSYRVARLSLLKGYPVDAVRIMRTVFENHLTALDISANPDNAKVLMDEKYSCFIGHLPGEPSALEGQVESPDGERLYIPSADKLIRRLIADDLAKQRELLILYHRLSQVDHPRYLGLALGRLETDEGLHLYLGGEFREDDAVYAYNVLLGLGIRTADMVGGLIAARDPNWQTRLDGLNREWETWKHKYDARIAAHLAEAGAC
jgi:hypothetical protein